MTEQSFNFETLKIQSIADSFEDGLPNETFPKEHPMACCCCCACAVVVPSKVE